MQLPENVLTCIRLLEENGHRAHVVGGCVRDFCLGKEPHDFDMTTDATPDEMREVFRGYRTVDTGIKHGTLTVLTGGEPLEITTWRVDGEYADHRHPQNVVFTKSLTEDLKRRDFTVNAMCYSPSEGLIDEFGGREDLAAGIIRAVGEPERRFEEDALRILRALRFASVLGFSVEKATADALREKKHLLGSVSAERIFSEWKKLLCGNSASRILTEFADVIEVFLPEADAARFPSLPENGDFLLRSLYLFAGVERAPERYLAACDRLRTDNETKRRGVGVLSHLTDSLSLSKTEILHLLFEIEKDDTELLLDLRAALGKGKGEKEILQTVLAERIPYRIADLAVGGKDLTQRGIRGKEVGETLKDLLFAVMDGEVPNEKEKLLASIARK